MVERRRDRCGTSCGRRHRDRLRHRRPQLAGLETQHAEAFDDDAIIRATIICATIIRAPELWSVRGSSSGDGPGTFGP